ncbi:Yip1 family protein [uncultured Methanolobus sp.]|uniref:Yip1 family protein n=1 Tax=uncultured Methanolobus sp. TaxID=218300 RepID=UPI002AAC1A3C|nr:Yip1 family protein [uncultured Methanolobus sp.]
MFELFKNPSEFFRKKVSEPEELKRPFCIIVSLWLARMFMLSTILVLLMTNSSSKFSTEFTPITSDMYVFFLVILLMVLIFSFIGTLFLWITTAGVFYLFSALFRGKGSFKRVLAFTSYGFIPYIIDIITSPLYFWVIIQKVDFFSMIETLDQNGDISVFINELLYANLPLNIISTLFSILLFILALYIWINGIKYGRNLSTKKAILTVGIPAVLYVIYKIFMLMLYFI